MRHAVNLSALLIRTVMLVVVAGSGLTMSPYGLAAEIEFVDTPKSTQAGAPRPMGPASLYRTQKAPQQKSAENRAMM